MTNDSAMIESATSYTGVRSVIVSNYLSLEPDEFLLMNGSEIAENVMVNCHCTVGGLSL